MIVDRKHSGKDIHIAFLSGQNCYIYDHDALVLHVEEYGLIGEQAVSWNERGLYTWPHLPSWAIAFLSKYRI